MRAQRFDDPAVLLDLRRLVVAVELQQREPELALGTLVCRREPAAAERRHERAVKREVAFERLDEVTALESVRECVGGGGERLDVRDGRQRGALDHLPKPVEVGDLVFGEVGDDDAAVRVVRHEALLGEAAQRLAQRVAGDAERRRELHLAQAGAGFERALEDEPAQRPLRLRAGRRAVERGDERLGAHSSSARTAATRSRAGPRKSGSKPTESRKWPSLPSIEPGTTSTDARVRIASATCSDGRAAA